MPLIPLIGRTTGVLRKAIDKRFPTIQGLGLPNVFGIFGAEMTGVISNADINANIAGYQFYSDLYQAFLNNNVLKFRFASLQTWQWNEQIEPNTFVPWLRDFGKIKYNWD